MNHLVDQYFDSLSDKKVAVLGIGVSNRPLIRMLLARGIHVLACDKTPREKLDAEVLELEQAEAVEAAAQRAADRELDRRQRVAGRPFSLVRYIAGIVAGNLEGIEFQSTHPRGVRRLFWQR